MLGYYSNKRWKSTDGNRCDEIAINPDYIAHVSYIKLMQTIVHEMAHCWQYHFGTPSRVGYHNKEWADKMRSIGLIPSSTGKPGGKVLGQQMDDYPDPKGKFLKACVALLKDKKYPIHWVDVYSRPPSLDIDKLQVAQQTLQNESGREEAITRLLDDLNITPEVTSIIQQLVFDTQVNQQPVVPEDIKNPSKSKRKYTCPGCMLNVWGKPDLFIKCGNCDESLVTQ
jgi:hypothetical protein